MLISTAIFSVYGAETEPAKYKTVSDLNSKNCVIAVEAQTLTEIAAKEVLPNAQYMYVTSLINGFLAVKSGHAYAYAADLSTFDNAVKAGMTGLKIFGGQIGQTGNTATGISPKSSIKNAKKLIDDFIIEMKSKGIIDDMHKRWVIDNNDVMPEIPAPSSPTMTIKIGTTGLVPPILFIKTKSLPDMKSS